MKQSFQYNIKKGFIFGLLATLPFFSGCEKDPEPTPQKHNVELKYGTNPNTQWQNISMDTIYKYNADPTVDTIFMIPEQTNQYATLSANGCKTVIDLLRPRHNVNPNKVFGKGDLVLRPSVISENPEIVRFFADTLRYNVR